MNNLDILAIGDITTDAFIRLKDAEVHCQVDNKNCQICMDFGTKIPYEFVQVVPAVGNSPNAAVAAARLGLKSGLLTNMGTDRNAEDCLAKLKKEGVLTDYIKIHDGKKTNYHYVLWYQDERTILIKHEEYDYEMPFVGLPKWIYLSSLGEKSLDFHTKIIEYLKKGPEIKLAFQPGTFQISLGHEKLKEVYKRSKVFICNIEEAQKILGSKEQNIAKIIMAIRELGPEIILLTNGKNGAYMYHDKSTYFMPPYPDESNPYERTGAGDAFASTFVSALALGKSPVEAIRLAPINSMSVVQKIGAQEGLLTMEKMEQYLKNAPESYKAEIVLED